MTSSDGFLERVERGVPSIFVMLLPLHQECGAPLRQTLPPAKLLVVFVLLFAQLPAQLYYAYMVHCRYDLGYHQDYQNVKNT